MCGLYESAIDVSCMCDSFSVRSSEHGQWVPGVKGVIFLAKDPCGVHKAMSFKFVRLFVKMSCNEKRKSPTTRDSRSALVSVSCAIEHRALLMCVSETQAVLDVWATNVFVKGYIRAIAGIQFLKAYYIYSLTQWNNYWFTECSWVTCI